MSCRDLAGPRTVRSFLPLFHTYHRRSVAALLRHSVLGSVLSLLIFLMVKAANAQNPTTLLEQARIDEKAGNYVAAEKVYEKALAVEPGNLEIHKRLGVVQQTQLKFADSIFHFKRVLAGDPKFTCQMGAAAAASFASNA